MVTKQPLWRPSEERIKNANMTRFIEFINKRYCEQFGSYEELYQWSIENIPEFWASMWEFGEIKTSRGYDVVVNDLDKMPGAKWFIGARLNFAENLLRCRDDHLSLIFRGETGESVRITYAQLYEEVGRLADRSYPRREGGRLHAQSDRNCRCHVGLDQHRGGMVILLTRLWH